MTARKQTSPAADKALSSPYLSQSKAPGGGQRLRGKKQNRSQPEAVSCGPRTRTKRPAPQPAPREGEPREPSAGLRRAPPLSGCAEPPDGGACRPYLPVGDVDCQIDVPEGARADLPHQLVFAPDDELGLGAAATRHGDRRPRGAPGAAGLRGRERGERALPPPREGERGRGGKEDAWRTKNGGPRRSDRAGPLGRPPRSAALPRSPAGSRWLPAPSGKVRGGRRGAAREREGRGEGKREARWLRRVPAAAGPYSAAAAILSLNHCYRGHKMPPACSRRFFTARGTLGAGRGGPAHALRRGRLLPATRLRERQRGRGQGGETAAGSPPRVRAHRPSVVPMNAVVFHPPPAQRRDAFWVCACASLKLEAGRKGRGVRALSAP